jgi:hypothetical protein
MSLIRFYKFNETKTGWECSGIYIDDMKGKYNTFASKIKQVSINEVKNIDESNIYIFGNDGTIYNIVTTLELQLDCSEVINTTYYDMNMPETVYIGMVGSILTKL